MNKLKIVILAAAGLAFAAWLFSYASPGLYQRVRAADEASSNQGWVLAFSGDCEHWLESGDSYLAFAAKSLASAIARPYGSYEFVRMSNKTLGTTVQVLDAKADDLLNLTAGEQSWYVNQGERIVQVSSGGYLSAVSLVNKLDYQGVAPTSSVVIIPSIGKNTAETVGLANAKGRATVVQIRGDDSLVCGEETGCAFAKKGAGRITDRDRIAELKRGWDRTPLKDLGPACAFVANPESLKALGRFSVADGACHGLADTKPLKAGFSQRISDCKAYTAKIAPQIEAFFAVP